MHKYGEGAFSELVIFSRSISAKLWVINPIYFECKDSRVISTNTISPLNFPPLKIINKILEHSVILIKNFSIA